jgi:hypothetical protein
LIEKSGGWFKYKDEKIQGKEKALIWLKENPNLLEDFTNKVKDFVNKSFEQTSEDAEKMALQDEESELDYDPETGEVFE